MNVELAPGKYVLAVSGGVDSMVLLYLLATRPGIELVVAHFDHGIRADSAEDRQLVEATSKRLGVPFIYKNGELGAGTSEALAREKRYEFLREVMQATGARAIVTAHHQDDLLETIVLNLTRGSGRKGLAPLRSQTDVVRPLLHLKKQQLVQYARANHIPWREDSTNSNPAYRRNFVRQQVMPKLTSHGRAELVGHAERMYTLNDEIDELLADLTATQTDAYTIDRAFFIQLPHAVACEYMAAWLRRHQAAFDRKTIERLVVFAKTAHPGKRADVGGDSALRASKKHITLEPRRAKGSV